uniref:Bm14328 n=1 Tax=Brugia malayi TaxID=6279 RepID=A0A1I9G9Q5_BRUMA|nr:Bm14328 [Brugia malayi]
MLRSIMQKFTIYVGWWRQLVNNICNHPLRTLECWNNTVSIDVR